MTDVIKVEIEKPKSQQPVRHDTFIEALAAAQFEFTPVKKNRTAKIRAKAGGEYSYKYADLGDVLGMAVPALSRHGIVVTQPLKIVTTPQGTELRIVTELYWGSAEKPAKASDGLSISEDLDPQDFGAVMSYWRRYDLCSLCGIAPEEDIDGRTSAGETRSDRQAHSNDQPQVVKEFYGKALDVKRGQADSGPFMRFNIHNEESTFISFNESTFEMIEKEGLTLRGTAEARRDSKNVIWYRVVKIESDAPVRNEPVNENAGPVEMPTVAQSLNGLFEGPNALKHKRLIEALISKYPQVVQVALAQNFAARVKRENTKGEAGLMTALDIAVQEIQGSNDGGEEKP